MIAYDRLSQIIPPDWALANKALQASLSQISNITQITLPSLASAFKYIETTRNLNDISTLTQPLPDNVINYYNNIVANGSGPDGTLVLTDVLGAAVGTGYIGPLENTTEIINDLTSDGTLTDLISIYGQMANTVNGVYGNPDLGPVVIPSGPAAGSYANAEVAFSTALIPVAQSEISNVIAANSTATTSMNTDFDDMAIKLLSENSALNDAGIDIGNLTAISGPSLSFAQTLLSYSDQIQQDGPAWFLEQVADTTTQGGQALVACMREGRNQVVLNTVNIISADIVEPLPTTVIPATLTSGTYTVEQAANLIVR